MLCGDDGRRDGGGGACALSVEYVRERKQFGKPLASFQAIQQQLALFAAETAATSAAAAAAFHALRPRPRPFGMRRSEAPGEHGRRCRNLRGASGALARWGLPRNTGCKVSPRKLWASAQSERKRPHLGDAHRRRGRGARRGLISGLI